MGSNTEQTPSFDEVIETKKTKRPKKKKRSKKLIITVIILVLAATLLLGTIRFCSAGVRRDVDVYTYTKVERRDISESLTGSGTLDPADSYSVMTLVSGEILSADFEEGDFVNKDDVLYEIDSSDASKSIERAEIALSQSQRNYNKKSSSRTDLTVKAPIGGVVSGLSADVGDSVNMNAPILTIENTATLSLTEYYSTAYSDSIYVGMPASVSVVGYSQTFDGRVSEVSSLTRVSQTGMTCFAVTVEVDNPGILSEGISATAKLGADIYPSIADDDGLNSSARRVVYAEISGDVAQVNVKNGDTVSAGMTLLTLSSENLSDDIQNAADSLREAQLSLEGQYDSLEDYTITAPISGTIVDKYYKTGEKTSMGEMLCIIYDMSSLTMTLEVDELDISRVALGQTAVITAAAVEGKTYTGVVTRIGVNGTVANGVTTYPVDIRIDSTEGLLPGMNVDVTIVTDSRTGTLCIPADAVDRSKRVLVKTDDGSTGEGAPEGYKYVSVQIGIADDNYVEILSGLSENDEIAYIPPTASGNMFMFPMMGGADMNMGGNMNMGGMPMGGGR